MKDNKVIFWSTIEGLEEIVPPQPAKKYIPEWWKWDQNFLQLDKKWRRYEHMDRVLEKRR